MSRQFQPGQQITVNAYGGKKPIVTVVKDLGDTVLICRPEEFDKAKLQKRPPLTIGLHREDIVGNSSGYCQNEAAKHKDS